MKKRKLNFTEIIKSLLNEGASDVAYHYTKYDSINNILDTNSFNLTLAIGSEKDFEINNGKYFYFSTTRSKSSGYKEGSIRLKLNVRELKHNYEMIPVDYFQKSKSLKDYDDPRDYKRALMSLEQEDRIIGDFSTIPNARNYIISIEALLDSNKINRLILRAEKYDVPLFVYKTLEDFKLSRNPIDYEKYVVRGKFDYNAIYDIDDEFFTIAAVIAYNNQNNYNYIVNNILQNNEDYITSLDYNLDHIVVSTLNNNNPYFGYLLFNDIRNSPNMEMKKLFELLVREMKKAGTKRFEDYLKYKRNTNQ